MAQFPRYSSQRQLTTEKPAPFKDEAATKTKITGDALVAAQNMAIKWSRALVTSQINALNANKGTFLADVKSRAALESDPNASKKYLKEVEDFSKTAMKDMSEQAKAEAGLDFKSDIDLAKIYINSTFQQKIIKQAADNLTVSLEGCQQGLLTTNNANELQKKFTDAFVHIDRNVDDGIISPDKGKILKDKFVEDARLGFIDRDLYSDPDLFKKNAANGVYEFKDAKEKSDKLAKANSLIKASEDLAKWQEKQIHTLGAYNLSNGLLDRSLTPETVKKMYRNGEIDSETAAIFDQVLTDGTYEIPEATTLPKPDFFLRLLDQTLDDKTESLAIMKQAARAYGSNEMGANQYAYFINEANKRFNRQKAGLPLLDKTMEAFKSNAKNIKDWAMAFVPGVKEAVTLAADMITQMMERTQAGEDSDVVADDIKRQERVKKYTWIKNLPAEGQRRMCPDGVVRRFYPDGRIEDSK